MSELARLARLARRRRPAPSGHWWAAAALLIAVLAGTLGVGAPSHVHILPGATAAPAVAPVAPVQPARPVEPVALTIPAIKVSTPLTGLGLNPDGTVEVPADYDEAGWYRLGPVPGHRGSAVILGHVDSYRGEAVFFRLKLLKPGDEVEVRMSDGATIRFAVTYLASYPKEQFPANFVYGDHGISTLQLVTCGGDFDKHLRSYLSNVVVYTKLLGAGPAA